MTLIITIEHTREILHVRSRNENLQIISRSRPCNIDCESATFIILLELPFLNFLSMGLFMFHKCFLFWYSIYGNGTQILNIVYDVTLGATILTTKWHVQLHHHWNSRPRLLWSCLEALMSNYSKDVHTFCFLKQYYESIKTTPLPIPTTPPPPPNKNNNNNLAIEASVTNLILHVWLTNVAAIDTGLWELAKATFTLDTVPTYDQCRPIFIAWSGMIG